MNHFQRETCCLLFATIFTEEHRGPIESFITWCSNNLKPNISETRSAALCLLVCKLIEKFQGGNNVLSSQRLTKCDICLQSPFCSWGMAECYDVTVKLTFADLLAIKCHHCGSGVEPTSCYLKVAGLIPLVCMSKCPWARWTPNCSWCAGWHLAWQPPPSVYECMYKLL